jgi:hypothetical protein
LTVIFGNLNESALATYVIWCSFKKVTKKTPSKNKNKTKQKQNRTKIKKQKTKQNIELLSVMNNKH